MSRFIAAASSGAILAALAAAFGAAQAQDADKQKSIWTQDTLTGDWGGARSALKDKSGIEITLTEIGEAQAVVSGGLRQRGSLQGRFEFSVETDLSKLAGWTGASTHVTLYQIHNTTPTVGQNAGSIADPSNIDALATTRLFTAWFQQGATDSPFSIRAGQLAADDEFLTSVTASGLINGTFGWAGLLAADMLSGGPAYPLTAPGVRIQVRPADNLALLGAVFSGDPAGHNCNEVPQQCNRYGTTFSFSGGTLWIGELQYSINQGKDAAGLPGVYKLGGWYANAGFADQHFGLDGAGGIVSLADPASAMPFTHRGNGGVYAVADQMVWRAGERSLNLFVRGGASPADRNFISYYVDGGAGLKGAVPGRADDTLTFGFAYAKISRDAAALDRDTLAFNGPPYPIRDEEVVFELSYAAQIAPWWTVQPDLQYIVHPGGNVPDPGNPFLAVRNAFIAGMRSTIKF